jgi:hypothetical protein
VVWLERRSRKRSDELGDVESNTLALSGKLPKRESVNIC